jgi:hypothetical protein
MLSHVIEVSKIIMLVAIFFVWVVRYENIIEEFKFYNYPNWLRDLVGILKLASAVMLVQSNDLIVRIGSSAIIFLMLAAVITHLRVKNKFKKILPSITLLLLSSFVLFSTYA